MRCTVCSAETTNRHRVCSACCAEATRRECEEQGVEFVVTDPARNAWLWRVLYGRKQGAA